MVHVPKIHFINRIDKENAGDWYCSPLLYYYDYFMQFNIIRHDVDYIDWGVIEKDDVVIIGGSGMLYVTLSFQRAINRLLDQCDTVIAWSVGFNTHNHQWYQGDQFPNIDFERFALIAIRDYNHPSGLNYLPCPSVLALDRPNRDIVIKRKYGVIEHKDLPIAGLSGFNRIKNSATLSEIQEYIESSEAIVTNSYHCAYWTQLLGKKTIIVNKFSTKFDYFELPPQFIEAEGKTEEQLKKELDHAFQEAEVNTLFFDRAVELNHIFFEKVQRIIEQKQIPKNKKYQDWYEMTVLQLWNRQAQAGKIRAEICELHEDVYANIEKINREIKSLSENNTKLQAELDWMRKPFWERVLRKIKYMVLNRGK